MIKIKGISYKTCFKPLVKRCYICSEHSLVADMFNVDYARLKGKLLCYECYLTFTVCKSCHNIKKIHETDGNICFKCNQERTIKYFNCLSHKHLLFIKKDKNKKIYSDFEKNIRYFGIELEYQINHPIYLPHEKYEDFEALQFRIMIAKEVQDFMGQDIIIKHDGSIGYGFEIVSAPATFEVHQEIWEKFFNTFLKTKKLKTAFNCGMHIHINKSSLSLLQMGKFLNFIYAQDNRNFIRHISGRESPYASLKLNKNITDIKKNNHSKYEAINYKGKNTIEIRTFIAPETKEDFYKNLEFVDCLIEFSKNVSITQCSSKKEFIVFVFKNKKKYAHLYRWMCNEAKKSV